ncbi:MAG: hypothetical protein H6686_08700 [Fibrobacteria bacterium]|nr:hypothetical protein [Fibrobacteria bacterium]
MIPYGVVLWHLALAAFLVLVGALSARLGKAMRDDIGDVRHFTWAAILLGLSGVFKALIAFWPDATWASSSLGLLGFALAARAGWKTWGWIPSELRRSKKGSH